MTVVASLLAEAFEGKSFEDASISVCSIDGKAVIHADRGGRRITSIRLTLDQAAILAASLSVAISRGGK